MKAINIGEDIRRINGIPIYEILKSLINSDNYSEEDFEYELPKQKKNFYRYCRIK